MCKNVIWDHWIGNPPTLKTPPASIKMIACVCYASADGPRTDMLHVHKGPPGFLCGYTKRRLCCFILKQSTQVVEPQINVLNVTDVAVMKSLIKSYGTASSLSARTRAVGGGRERERGEAAVARFPCLGSGLTASCAAATATTTTSWICFLQLH